jgi:transcriptional regulator with XRE-family HTH domain
MVDGSPTVRRRRLGLILRGLRERARMTGEEVGAAIERSGSWVSRVETGRVGLRGRDLRDLLELYRVDDPKLTEELLILAREGKQRGWWSKYADTISAPYAAYIGFEAEASALLTYDTLIVNGLLQTEDYARAVFKAVVPPADGDSLERLIKVRMARQELVYREDPLVLWAILDESVLRRRIGGPVVLRNQIKRLIEALDTPHVTIQIVPHAGGANPGMVGSFTIIRFPLGPDPDVVYVEGGTGDIFLEGVDAYWYNGVFDHLRAAALSPADSRDMLERTWEELAED